MKLLSVSLLIVLTVRLQDWRIHVDQMHQHRDGIRSSLKEAKVRSLTCCGNSVWGEVAIFVYVCAADGVLLHPLLPLQSYLDKLQEDIGKTLEKVSSREKYINNQLEHLVQEYRSAQAQLSEVNTSLADWRCGRMFCPDVCPQTGAGPSNKPVFSTRLRSATSRPVEE